MDIATIPDRPGYIRAQSECADKAVSFHLNNIIATTEVNLPLPTCYENPDLNEAEKRLHAIIQGAAETLDAIQGKRGQRGNLRKKVRKLLGYTYP